ncbi:MAG: MgtC/SapB family protein [Myxococcota bacterium]
MERYEPYISLGLATLTGLLIGLEREHSRPPPEEKRAFLGGVRTYPLIALIGGASMLLVPRLGPWALVVSGLTLAVLLALSYWRDAETGHTGITSEASALLAFLLGALSLAGESVGRFEVRVFVVASVAVVSTCSRRRPSCASSARSSRATTSSPPSSSCSSRWSPCPSPPTSPTARGGCSTRSASGCW